MLQIGDIVFEAGNFITDTIEVKVTEDNINRILMFWNKVYFDNREEAEKVRLNDVGNYCEWLINI